ncbi:hypothetical protein DNTS_006045 [Danionella cerebrum]|uniref:Fibronectin type-III domain-containing protein n=1 Tax=Danionella cerebrum TaxID=2873325 RepID=A0A553RQC4_9TELE|nr:hypothetical protein DNTS_006045 [Danionella translucida]
MKTFSRLFETALNEESCGVRVWLVGTRTEVMRSRLTDGLFVLLLQFHVGYSSSEPAHHTVSMYSVNMKHVLKWSPPQASCSTLNYTVQFQGEYELLKRNGSWVDAYECQEITENTCDLTHDLSSNSNYSIRVQTHCDAVLLALKLTVNLQMDMILVGITLMSFQILIHVMRAPPYQKSITADRIGERMCFRAEALIETINRSCSTDVQCVHIPYQMTVLPVVVSVSVILVALTLVLGWSMSRFSSQIKCICHKEAIPNALLDDWPKRPPVLQSSSPEPTEPILLLPAEIQCRTMQQTDINVTRDYWLSQTI